MKDTKIAVPQKPLPAPGTLRIKVGQVNAQPGPAAPCMTLVY